MRKTMVPVGMLMLLALCRSAPGQSPPAQGQSPPALGVARTRTFPVHYAVHPQSAPLSRVELWYTFGDDGAWHRYGEDDDRQSPLEFTAPAEGEYGLYIIASNATGPSSPAPGPRTQPHQRVLVDYTPPVIQMPQPRLDSTAHEAVLHVRWTALDAQWGSRPIEIAYRHADANDWHPVCDDRLANAGQYDWRIPADLTGVILVRVSAWDRAGNRGEAVSDPIGLALAGVEPSGLAGPVNGPPQSNGATPRNSEAARLSRLNDDVSKLDSSTYGQAAAQLRDLLQRRPTDAAAVAEVGNALYALGDHDRALEAFDLALERDGGWVPALIGAARVRAERNDFDSAATLLETLLERDSADGLGWLALGDVRLKQGNDLMAQQCYRKAAMSRNNEIVQQARRRLDDMEALRRRLDAGARASNSKEH